MSLTVQTDFRFPTWAEHARFVADHIEGAQRTIGGVEGDIAAATLRDAADKWERQSDSIACLSLALAVAQDPSLLLDLNDEQKVAVRSANSLVRSMSSLPFTIGLA